MGTYAAGKLRVHCGKRRGKQSVGQLKQHPEKYDKNGMLIGEAPCTKDMIEITDHDFQVVTVISIAADICDYFTGPKECFTACNSCCSHRICNIH